MDEKPVKVLKEKIKMGIAKSQIDGTRINNFMKEVEPAKTLKSLTPKNLFMEFRREGKKLLITCRCPSPLIDSEFGTCAGRIAGEAAHLVLSGKLESVTVDMKEC